MTTKVANTTRAHRESIVNEHIEAEAVRHDVAATVKTFKHPRYEVPALGTVADGAEAVTGFLQGVLTAFPDFYIKKTAVHPTDDAASWSVVFGGTQRGEWAGIKPGGKKVEVPSHQNWYLSCSAPVGVSARQSKLFGHHPIDESGWEHIRK